MNQNNKRVHSEIEYKSSVHGIYEPSLNSKHSDEQQGHTKKTKGELKRLNDLNWRRFFVKWKHEIIALLGEKGEAHLLFKYSFFRMLFQNVKCQSSLTINSVNFVNLLLTIVCSKYRITAWGENQAVFMKSSRVFLDFLGCRRMYATKSSKIWNCSTICLVT